MAMHGMRKLFLTALLVASCCLAQAQGCTKTVRWYNDAPYSFRDAQGQIQGMNVDIARIALKQMGCEAILVEMPWARALIELEQGRLDVLPGALRKPDREVFAHFSRPTNRSPNVLFIGKQAAKKYTINQLSDLSATHFRLGAQINVSYGTSYEVLLSNPDFKSRLTPVTSRLGAWQMIERDRIDGIIADEVSGLLELQQLGLTDVVTRSRVVVSEEPAMFAFSKKTVTTDFVNAFNTAFGAMLADGRYKEITQRYMPCTVVVEKLGCK